MGIVQGTSDNTESSKTNKNIIRKKKENLFNATFIIKSKHLNYVQPDAFFKIFNIYIQQIYYILLKNITRMF